MEREISRFCPGKLTDEVQTKILFAISTGNTEETAAEYAGIDGSTFFRWMSKGREGKPGYSEFYEAVKTARTEAEMRHVAVVQLAVVSGDWRAAQFWLERRRHDKWGKKESVELVIQREAERLAKDTGINAEEIVAEAKKLMGVS